MQVHNLADSEIQPEMLNEWNRSERAGAHAAVAHASASILWISYRSTIRLRSVKQQQLPPAQERGIAVHVNWLFAGSHVFHQEQPLPPCARDFVCHGWAQVLLKFMLSHPAVTCAIPAAAYVAHRGENRKAIHSSLPETALRAYINASSAVA